MNRFLPVPQNARLVQGDSNRRIFLQELEKFQVCLRVGIFEDRLEIADRLVIVDTKGQFELAHLLEKLHCEIDVLLRICPDVVYEIIKVVCRLAEIVVKPPVIDQSLQSTVVVIQTISKFPGRN